MNTVELAVTERNRLIRFNLATSIVAFALATWARDPRLNFTTPFSGSEAGNITVGHAVLIGHPVLCMLFFVLVAQIVRYTALVEQLPDVEKNHLRWKAIRREDDSRWTRMTHRVCDFFRWFGMVGIPAVACGFLLDAQTDFFNEALCGSDRKYSYTNMVDLELYDEFFGIQPSYMSVRKTNCNEKKTEDAKVRCRKDQKILSRMPTLYQPYNFLFGVVFQMMVILGLVSTARIYFGRSDSDR